MKIKKIKTKTHAQLKRELDKVFSDYIRERDKYTCITCTKQGTKADIQNGHYIERNKIGTRYDEENCNAQCVTCNVWKKGNLRVYAVQLIRKYGEGVLERLLGKANSNQGKKMSVSILEEKIIYYKNKIAQLRG
jgi:5-methylcytosine-specific restriction endonuclease McrA